MSHLEGGSPRNNAEREPMVRLQTDLIFMRHGVAEKLEGADETSAIDALRKHTPEGVNQVYEGGKKAAVELGLNPNDSVVIVSRSSPRERAKQTVEGGLQGFLDQLKEQEMVDKQIDRQTSNKPTRKEFDYGNHTTIYAAGANRRGSTKGLSEQWTRHPEILQQDINKAIDFARKDNPEEGNNADELLSGMKTSYQKTVAVIDRASTMLAEKWRNNDEKKGDKPPRLVVLEGAHGFVSEPWLKEVVSEYEQEASEQVPLELGYGEFFRIHWSSNPQEQPVLHIGGKQISIKQEHLVKLNKPEGNE